MREAATEAFYAEEGIVPLTIVYEDFIHNYEGTVLAVLQYLGIPTETVRVATPFLDQISDNVAEQWVLRYREECQWVGKTALGSEERESREWNIRKTDEKIIQKVIVCQRKLVIQRVILYLGTIPTVTKFSSYATSTI